MNKRKKQKKVYYEEELYFKWRKDIIIYGKV